MIFRRSRKLATGKVVTYPHWWFQFQRDGVFVRVNTKQADKTVAKELENAHRTSLAKDEAGFRDRRDVPTFARFAERFVEMAEVHYASKPGTLRFYKQKLTDLLAFPALAQARLDRIDEALIERFVQRRSKQIAHPKREAKDEDKPRNVVSPASVNRALTTLRRILRQAQEWRVITYVPKIKMLQGEKTRDFVLSRSVEQQYLDGCSQPLLDFATLILDTGLRAGEALALEWSDVYLAPVGKARFGYVRIRKGKSKNARRNVSLTARATALLTGRKGEAVDQFVFSNGRGRPYAVTYLDHRHLKVREKLGWSDEFVIHTLRHTMLTRLGEAGVDAFSIMRIAGHSSITISQRYVHPSPEALEAAFEKLEEQSRTASTPPEKNTACLPQVVENAA